MHACIHTHSNAFDTLTARFGRIKLLGSRVTNSSPIFSFNNLANFRSFKKCFGVCKDGNQRSPVNEIKASGVTPEEINEHIQKSLLGLGI